MFCATICDYNITHRIVFIRTAISFIVLLPLLLLVRVRVLCFARLLRLLLRLLSLQRLLVCLTQETNEIPCKFRDLEKI